MKATIPNAEELVLATDPILELCGLGKELWILEPGDLFIARLRADDGGPDVEDLRSKSASDQ